MGLIRFAVKAAPLGIIITKTTQMQSRIKKLVEDREDQVRVPAAAPDGHLGFGFDQTETTGIKRAGTDRLQPGVIVIVSIAIIIETFIHIAKSIQDTIRGDIFTNIDLVGGSVVPNAIRVGFDLVRHGRDFVAVVHRMGSNCCAGDIICGGPHIERSDQVVTWVCIAVVGGLVKVFFA